ncbi:uncharacterized protein Tco025E_05659 [Trypanosoma conorhini]|uniref:C2H2-type domain-containing protein n=1 Tax=Trypanosoma conorhini TaxID=83891 RepID=A0A3R7KWR8_9TRYP|nr:uncharacterized protein Tco025E_05659 [Trypanosoma conorhini]RNF15001.1 hypothetical protein Tco025E_05659 [Trypanosoma conorhini]
MAAAGFQFVQGTERLDWGVLVAIDLQRLVKDTNVDTLQRIVENLAFARVTRDEAALFTPEHILHLFTLCQLVIQYLVCSQECLAKLNVRLTERGQEMQHRRDAAEAERERLHEENVILRKEVKAQRRTLLAYEYANTAGGGISAAHSYVCPQCGDAYAKKESLQSHMRKRHAAARDGAPPQQQQQQQQVEAAAAYESQQQRQLQEKVDRLEKLLEKEQERNDRMQHDSMLMLMQASMSGARATATTPPPSSPVPAPVQQTQEPVARLPQVHAPPPQVAPEISAIPVMPDLAALQRYNTARQQETANNALLRKISELEALVGELRSAKRDTAGARAAPAPEPIRTDTTPTLPTEALHRPPSQPQSQQPQTSLSSSTYTPSWLSATGTLLAGQTYTADRGERKPAAGPAAAPHVAPTAVPAAATAPAPPPPSLPPPPPPPLPSAPTSVVGAPAAAPSPSQPQVQAQQQQQQQQPPAQKQYTQSTPSAPQPLPAPAPAPAQASAPLSAVATAPTSSGPAQANPHYVSRPYVAVATTAPLNAPGASPPLLSAAPAAANSAASLKSEALLAKYGPPGPAIVPRALAKPSQPPPTGPAAGSAAAPLPVWLQPSPRQDESGKEPTGNASNAPLTGTSAAGASAAPPSIVPQLQSGPPPSLPLYPGVPVAAPVDVPHAAQQQAAPPATAGLESRPGGPAYAPPAIPLAPSYSGGVVTPGTGVPHAAAPVMREVKARSSSSRSRSSSFESSTSSDSS